MTRTNTSRHGRAPALEWRIDQDCADTIWFMTRCIRYGMSPAEVATQLNTHHPDTNHDDDCPPLLTLSGRLQAWTGRAVATLLTDPVLTGHSVWGRTHHGRPLPRRTWITSATVTHPPILDDATLARTVDILTGKPAIQPSTMRPAHACPARSRWRR